MAGEREKVGKGTGAPSVEDVVDPLDALADKYADAGDDAKEESEAGPATAGDDADDLSVGADASRERDENESPDQKDEEPDEVEPEDDEEAAGEEAPAPFLDEDGRAIEIDGRAVTAADFADPARLKVVAAVLKAGVNPHAFFAKATPAMQENASLKAEKVRLEGLVRAHEQRSRELEVAALGNEREPAFRPMPTTEDAKYHDVATGTFDFAALADDRKAWDEEKALWERNTLAPWRTRAVENRAKREKIERDRTEAASAENRRAEERLARSIAACEGYEKELGESAKPTNEEWTALKNASFALVEADKEAGWHTNPLTAVKLHGLELQIARLKAELAASTKSTSDSVKRSVARALDTPVGGKRVGATETAPGSLADHYVKRRQRGTATQADLNRELERQARKGIDPIDSIIAGSRSR